MTTIENVIKTNSGEERRGLLARYPLATYFILAFSMTWLLFSPAVLSEGFQLFPLNTAIATGLATIGVFFGPLTAALLVTGITEGKGGIKAFLRRFIQFRVGLGWYLLVIVGYPIVYLVGLLPVLGTEPYSGILQRLPAFITIYLPWLAIGVIFPGLAEEPGWRGFALPRLQRRYGPLLGTLILSSLVMLFHVPIYFVPSLTTLDSLDLPTILLQSLAGISVSFVWTWLFNNGRQSIFFAMLVHSASNFSPRLLKALLGPIPSDPVFQILLFGGISLLLIVLTRGRLSYQNERD